MSVNIPSQPAGSPVKILVVDDNNLWVKAMCFKLTRSGYQVATALDGAEAISAVRREKPDLVLLDITFPSDTAGAWDGFSIMEWLHHLEESRSIPFIIITGDDDIRNKERALANGAVAFFHKPVKHDELINAIDDTLRTSGSKPV
jgi:CheY-like chemotaxis protein